MKKYIVKNCPAIYQNFEDKFVCTSRIKQKGFPFYCQDCTDCIIKQIVDYCKYYTNNLYCCNEISSITDDVLELLEIEEVQ